MTQPFPIAVEWPRRVAAREPLAAAALAAAAGGILVAALAPGGDTASHLYRTWLLERGVLMWDLFWYGGHYPFAAYSVLYYPVAALVGNVPLAFAATVASALLFASVATREWGDAGRWPARVFALVAPAPLILGQYPYAVGLATLLATLVALQARRTWVAAAAAVATAAVSPLAFLFLLIALGAVFVTRPVARRAAVALGIAVALAGAAWAAAGVALVLGADYSFATSHLLAALGVAAGGAALAFRCGAREPLAAFFVAWSAACLLVYLIPDAVGVNVTRLRWLVFPLVLAAAARAGFRPRWLAVPVLAAALAYNAVPYGQFIRGATLSRDHDPAFWAPALAFLADRGDPSFRVEVVPTAAHWEAWYVPREGHAIARGWYRQLDLAENALLYESRLDATAYERWLRSRGVRYVLRPHVRLNQAGSEAEARLLASGRSGLRTVARMRDWTIYELPRATPVLTGPSSARVTELGHDEIAGEMEAAGVYRVHVRHTPLWSVDEGDVCVRRAADGQTLVTAARPGRFRLVVREDPRSLLAAAAGRSAASCSR